MKIPRIVGETLSNEGIVFVATADEGGIPNVSPRTAYALIDDETIAFCDWFRNKTYWNIQKNNRVAVSVVNVDNFNGYQLKGGVDFEVDAEKIQEIMLVMFTKNVHNQFNRVMQLMEGKYPPVVALFKPETIYPLAPSKSSSQELRKPKSLVV